MAELVQVKSDAHADCRIRTDSAVLFAERLHILPLRAAEIGKAVSSFPVFCGRHAVTGDWTISAMCSLEQGHNLFVADGEWSANYEPTCMQTYPLYLMRSPDDESQYAVGIDESSSAISKEEGEALFDANGNSSLYLNRIATILEADIDNDVATHHFCARLAELELFKSIHVVVQYADGGAQTITGLHTLDEDKLQSLPDEQLAELHKRGYLLSANAMLISIFQLNALVRKHNDVDGARQVQQVKLEVARDIGGSEVGL